MRIIVWGFRLDVSFWGFVLRRGGGRAGVYVCYLDNPCHLLHWGFFGAEHTVHEDRWELGICYWACFFDHADGVVPFLEGDGGFKAPGEEDTMVLEWPFLLGCLGVISEKGVDVSVDFVCQGVKFLVVFFLDWSSLILVSFLWVG